MKSIAILINRDLWIRLEREEANSVKVKIKGKDDPLHLINDRLKEGLGGQPLIEMDDQRFHLQDIDPFEFLEEAYAEEYYNQSEDEI